MENERRNIRRLVDLTVEERVERSKRLKEHLYGGKKYTNIDSQEKILKKLTDDATPIINMMKSEVSFSLDTDNLSVINAYVRWIEGIKGPNKHMYESNLYNNMSYA